MSQYLHSQLPRPEDIDDLIRSKLEEMSRREEKSFWPDERRRAVAREVLCG
jgi:hypothetical protein